MSQINQLTTQYTSNNNTIHQQLYELPQLATYNLQHKLSQSIQHILYDQQELLDSVREHVDSLQSTTHKSTLQSQLQQYQSQLNIHNQRYNSYQQLLSTGRTVPISAASGTTALSSTTSPSPQPSATTPYISIPIDQSEQYKSQRERLLGNKNLVDTAGDSLQRTTYTLHETTEIGSQTHNQLIQQREQLIKQRDTLDDTNQYLNRSKKVIQRMKRRLVTNKLITYFIILLEIGLLLMIAYIKYWS